MADIFVEFHEFSFTNNQRTRRISPPAPHPTVKLKGTGNLLLLRGTDRAVVVPFEFNVERPGGWIDYGEDRFDDAEGILRVQQFNKLCQALGYGKKPDQTQTGAALDILREAVTSAVRNEVARLLSPRQLEVKVQTI